jgi:hypothetical protein
MTFFLIHTDAPLIPLTQMIGADGTIAVGQAAAGGNDCFYGWAEQQHETGCKDRHVVRCTDAETVKWIATTLAILDYQVVVTTPDEAGNDIVVDSTMPMNYDNAHAH